MNEILQEVLPAVGTVLASALVALVTQMLRRYGIQLEAEKQAKLEHYVRLGVRYAEEQARQRLRAPQAMTGSEKLIAATDFVQAHLPKADPERVAKLAEALLPVERQTALAGAAPELP